MKTYLNKNNFPVDRHSTMAVWLLLFTLLLLPFTKSVAQDDAWIQKTWILQSCEIQQDSAGVKTAIPFNVSEGSQPRWLIFNSLTFINPYECSLYLYEDLLTGRYEIQENQLILDFLIAVLTYTFKHENDNLHLYRTATVFRGNPVKETLWSIHLIYQPN